MIDGKSFLNQPVKNYIRTCGNIEKIAMSQVDHCKLVAD